MPLTKEQALTVLQNAVAQSYLAEWEAGISARAPAPAGDGLRGDYLARAKKEQEMLFLRGELPLKDGDIPMREVVSAIGLTVDDLMPFIISQQSGFIKKDERHLYDVEVALRRKEVEAVAGVSWDHVQRLKPAFTAGRTR